jgi:hypothetical protein
VGRKREAVMWARRRRGGEETSRWWASCTFQPGR